MKPPSTRHSDILQRPPDELSASRRASVLDHENRLLRARLEGKGRIEADPVLRRELQEATSENRRLSVELDRVGRNLDHSRRQEAELRRRLEGQNQQATNLANRVTTMAEQLKGQNGRIQELSREVGKMRGLGHGVDTQAEIGPEDLEVTERVEALEAELAQARSDLDRLLLRLRSTPLVHLFRRWQGFRVIESRWSDR